MVRTQHAQQQQVALRTRPASGIPHADWKPHNIDFWSTGRSCRNARDQCHSLALSGALWEPVAASDATVKSA